MWFDNVTIVSVTGNDWKIHFWNISKDQAIDFLRNADMNEKRRTL